MNNYVGKMWILHI